MSFTNRDPYQEVQSVMEAHMVLHIGDEVKSKFGRAHVVGITLTERQWDKGERDGTSLSKVSWDLVTSGFAILDLSNGHWCYGDQVSPIVVTA